MIPKLLAMGKKTGFTPKGVVAKRSANNNSKKPRQGLKFSVADSDPMAARSNGNYP